MYTILLDSSHTKLAVGIAKNGIVLKSIIYEAWQEQSEHMIPELNNILTAFDVKREEIDDVMVAIGPGSYTGVRIAITIAKTMGCALNIPVYPLSSLRILKDGMKPSICVINARSKRSYVGVYQGSNIILEDTIMTNDELLEYISNHPDYVLCGNLNHLGLEGKETNTIVEMLSLKNDITPMVDSLSLKPVYMKD